MSAPTRPALTVTEDLNLPSSVPNEAGGLPAWLTEFATRLKQAFRIHRHVFPATLGSEMRVRSYTTATKPTAANAGVGAVIFVSDGGAGAVFQGSTGAAWVNLG